MLLWKRVLFSLISGLLGGALFALASPGDFWISLVGSGVLLALSCFILSIAWKWAGGGKSLAWMVALAFILRLGIGVFFSLELPEWGYDTPAQKSGYLFTDAFRRDQQSWELAKSNEPLWSSFSDNFYTDQYGGLLGLSAGVYRLFSPDVQRQNLILILGAFFAALGIPFLIQAIRFRWDADLARGCAWLVVLYPDSILFGSAQMREPFIIGLACIAFWGVMSWKLNRRWSLAALVLSLGALMLFSSMVAIIVFGMLAVIFWFDNLAPISPMWKRMGQIGLLLGLVLVLLFSWRWLNNASNWDMLLTETFSGWIKKVVDEAGPMFRLPIIAVYGLAQPVLPAALVAITARPVWYGIAVIRALGWYLLAPVLIYSIYTIFTQKNVKERKLLIWISIVTLAWLLIAAVRAGGDQWDNPRYRVNFIPWLALLSAWGLDWARKRKDFWLARWVVVEFIFVGYFLHWYLGRYFHLWNRMYFYKYVIWILVWSGLVLSSGWIWDWFQRIRKKKHLQNKNL